MKNIKLFTIILLLISSIFLGCVDTQKNTPVPTPITTNTPVYTVTATPTAIETTLAPTPIPTPNRISRSFRSEVDQWYGFKIVREINSTPFEYSNYTLNLYPGDTVMWINQADPDERLTIVSEQGLWENTSAILMQNYKTFKYTFTQPGNYGVYVKESRRSIHQKIVVSP